MDLEIRENDAYKRIKEGFPKKLYHYTSLGAFNGIVSNKELWLGSLSDMNDFDEVRSFCKNLEMSVCQRITGIEECFSFFDRLQKRISLEYPYAICFSTQEEDVSQWERYADNARGVCIEFDSLQLLRLFYYSKAIINEVYYDSKDGLIQHDFVDIICNYLEGKQIQFSSENGLFDSILSHAYFHKNWSFRMENEYRICSQWKLLIDCSKIEFEKFPQKVKSYMKINLEDLCVKYCVNYDSLISRVVIGPRSQQSIEELKKYLILNKCEELANRIEMSSCTLR